MNIYLDSRPNLTDLIEATILLRMMDLMTATVTMIFRLHHLVAGEAHMVANPAAIADHAVEVGMAHMAAVQAAVIQPVIVAEEHQAPVHELEQQDL